MQYRKLGTTDIEVSTVAMGCWAIVGDGTWGEQDRSDSLATIEAALDAGINFFDTAEGYGAGESEAMLGEVLSNRRDQVVIATKVSRSHLAAEDLQEACEASLKRLRTDYIDLYQIHWPSREVPIAETMQALERLKSQGKIRAIGVSNFGPQDLADLLAVGRCETNQLAYNLLFRAIEFEIQPKCVENDIGILCYSPIAQGLLTGKFSSADEVPEGRARTRHFSKNRPQTRHGEDGCEAETFEAIRKIRRISQQIGEPMGRVALAWLLHQPAVVSVLAGARRPEQVRENARAAQLKLSPDVLRQLSEATEPVKAKLGPNPDMWQSEPRMR